MTSKQETPAPPVVIGEPQGGAIREFGARLRRPFVALAWRWRTRWLLTREMVRVGRWHWSWWAAFKVTVGWLLTVVLLLWLARALLVILWKRGAWEYPLTFDPDTVCKTYSTSCSALTSSLTPLLTLGWSLVLFLLWRQRKVWRYLGRRARSDPRSLVLTAGSLLDDVVGREQLADALIVNLKDRDSRRPHVIVGSVGAGKTALLVYLTQRLASIGAVPVPVRLRDAQKEEDLDFCRLARQRFGQIVQPVVGSTAEEDRVWRWLRQSDRIVVLADGLEEALTDEAMVGQRDNVIRKAIRKAGQDDHLPLVIASRPHDPLRGMQAAITELEPLNEEAALKYIEASGSWRSDAVVLDRVVEAAQMVVSPLYLRIARDLHRRDLLEPLGGELGDEDLDALDRWTFRQDLLHAWMTALVEGKLHPELPIDPETRKAVIEYISALACIGLAQDTARVELRQLDPLLGSGTPERPGAGAEQAEWNEAVARELDRRMDKLRDGHEATPSGGSWDSRLSIAASAGTVTITVEPAEGPAEAAGMHGPWIDVRLAATWGTRMGLVRESTYAPPGPSSGSARDGRGQVQESAVHFQHSIIQAFLGSRYLGGILRGEDEEERFAFRRQAASWAAEPSARAGDRLLATLWPPPAAASPAGTGGGAALLQAALERGGRELLLAMVLHSRSLYGSCSCGGAAPADAQPCPVHVMASCLKDRADVLLRDAYLFRKLAGRRRPDHFEEKVEAFKHGLGLWALELLGDAVEVASVGSGHSGTDSVTELMHFAEREWAQFGAGEDRVRTQEAKLTFLEQCGSAARRAGPDESERAYLELFRIGCKEPDRSVRAAVAQCIGSGREAAFDAVYREIARRESVVRDARPPTVPRRAPTDSHSDLSPRLRRAADRHDTWAHEVFERGVAEQEAGEERERWHGVTLRAWLLPMLVESVPMSRHGGSPRDDLERLVRQVCASARAGQEHQPWGGGVAQSLGESCAVGTALAEGFRFAANRRPDPRANEEAREFLIKQAEELLRHSRYWYTRLTLVQALALWRLPDDVLAPQPIRGHGSDPRGQVKEWLRKDPPEKEHPLVLEAGEMAVRTLQTRRPERFLWIEPADVAGKFGTEAGLPARPRFHGRWIHPSSGWTSLDPRARQLLADVLLLLVLGERGYRPKDLFHFFERSMDAPVRLPACLSRDRSRLDPVRAVETGAQPGDNCRDDCGLGMCPYPAKAEAHLRAEFTEVFCLHQREMLRAWQLGSWGHLLLRRKATWQRHVPIAGLRRSWDQMGARARDVNPEEWGDRQTARPAHR